MTNGVNTDSEILGGDHPLLVAGEWTATGSWLEVRSPYDDRLVGRVACGDVETVDQAVRSARTAFDRGDFPQYERAAALERASELVAQRQEELAEIISAEAAKPMKQARAEAGRTVSTLLFSAVEARKLAGSVVPMSASAPGDGRLGLILRVPIGVVGAISPFNFPLNLVAHKLGPAIAAGDPVVLKPASSTPISALKLVEILLEAGVPNDWLHVIPGSGSAVGNPLVEHPDIAAITFTGSAPVGAAIRSKLPHTRVNLELGSNAPLIVNDDGDWEAAARLASIHSFSHAGQSCVSVQRIIIHSAVADRFISELTGHVEALTVGDPSDDQTDVGPVIDGNNRERIMSWIEDAIGGDTRLLSGGRVNDDGTIQPTLILEPSLDSLVWSEEIFGPVAVIRVVESFEEAIELANDSRYGLHAGVFTDSLDNALIAANTLDFGGVLINDVPTVRADQQPYGGVRESGNTREGPAFAIRDLTQERFVSFRRRG
ncbi:MAG: aldehyde dehydrogenase family protein [Thermoleophilia bacterium]|nr:aldehyde dehydrogenase family protein [Thermoleophilia bacterium]